MAQSLAQIPLFEGLDAAALERLEAACTWRNVAANAWALDYMGPGTEVFFVMRGHVRAQVSGAGRDTILRDIQAGEYFGELSALDGQPRSAGIFAVTNAQLAVLPGAVFRRAIHEHPAVCDRVLAVLVGQIRSLSNRANENAGLNMRHRLWAELLRLARPPARPEDEVVVSPPPTHAELAARVAARREAVSRELGALERDGLITRRPGAIVLLDAARLRALVEAAVAG